MISVSRQLEREMDRGANHGSGTQGGEQASKKIENGETQYGAGNPPGAPGGAALGEADNS